MEMGDTGEWIYRDSKQRTYTEEITDRERERKRWRWEAWEVHAGSAAHHGCDGLGPMY